MMAEIPAPAAAAPVSVELPSPVVVEVTVAVDSAEPEPEAWVALAPSAEERTERALAPVVAWPEEADWRASGGGVSRWKHGDIHGLYSLAQYWVPKAITVEASPEPQASLAQSRTP